MAYRSIRQQKQAGTLSYRAADTEADTTSCTNSHSDNDNTSHGGEYHLYRCFSNQYYLLPTHYLLYLKSIHA